MKKNIIGVMISIGIGIGASLIAILITGYTDLYMSRIYLAIYTFISRWSLRLPELSGMIGAMAILAITLYATRDTSNDIY